MGFVKSANVFADANALSSMLVPNCSSISIINSTRSNELSPSSSTAVSGVRVRPGAYLWSKLARPVAGFDTRSRIPFCTRSAISVRRSLRVVVVRGRSPSVQTETERIF